jgi:hypothetical protein
VSESEVMARAEAATPSKGVRQLGLVEEAALQGVDAHKTSILCANMSSKCIK